MEVMVLLIFFSLIVAIGFLLAFIWALKKGQFDDMLTPSIRMLFNENGKEDNNKIGER